MKNYAVHIIVSVTLCSPYLVGAEDNADKAREALDKAKALFDAERYSDAAQAFRSAHRLNPSWKLWYNIGQSEAAANHIGLALQAFEAYLSEGGDGVPVEKEEEVTAEVERLRKLVGYLEFSVPDSHLVMVDELYRGIAPLPGALPVAAGTVHRVRILRDDNFEVLSKEVVVNGQQSTLISLSPSTDAHSEPKIHENAKSYTGAPVEPAATPARPASPVPVVDIKDMKSEAPKPSPTVPVGIAVASTGVAILIAAIGTGVAAKSIDNRLTNDCPEGECSSAYWDDNGKMQNLQASTNILIGIGSAFALSGVILVSVGKIRNNKKGTAMVLEPSFSSIGWRF
jgi:hypothetical protein